MLEERMRNQNLEREQEQIDRIVRESGGKLTRRLVNSQVTQCFLPPRGPVSAVCLRCGTCVPPVHACLRAPRTALGVEKLTCVRELHGQSYPLALGFLSKVNVF